MRTPGEDEELAVGFLTGEALIGGPVDVRSAGPTADFAANVVEVHTTGGLRRDPSAERRFHLTSSCGVCGKGALEDVRLAAPPAPAPPQPVTPERVLELPRRSREQQAGFDRTGGLHATGLFDAGGRLLVLREDVGRHNAMDKAIGSLLLAGRRPPPGTLASLSGRIGFELVQKAALAGLAGLVAVGAPTSRWPSSWRRSAGWCSVDSCAESASTSTPAPSTCAACRHRAGPAPSSNSLPRAWRSSPS